MKGRLVPEQITPDESKFLTAPKAQEFLNNLEEREKKNIRDIVNVDAFLVQKPSEKSPLWEKIKTLNRAELIAIQKYLINQWLTTKSSPVYVKKTKEANPESSSEQEPEHKPLSEQPVDPHPEIRTNEKNSPQISDQSWIKKQAKRAWSWIKENKKPILFWTLAGAGLAVATIFTLGAAGVIGAGVVGGVTAGSIWTAGSAAFPIVGTAIVTNIGLGGTVAAIPSATVGIGVGAPALGGALLGAGVAKRETIWSGLKSLSRKIKNFFLGKAGQLKQQANKRVDDLVNVASEREPDNSAINKAFQDLNKVIKEETVPADDKTIAYSVRIDVHNPLGRAESVIQAKALAERARQAKYNTPGYQAAKQKLEADEFKKLEEVAKVTFLALIEKERAEFGQCILRDSNICLGVGLIYNILVRKAVEKQDMNLLSDIHRILFDDAKEWGKQNSKQGITHDPVGVFSNGILSVLTEDLKEILTKDMLKKIADNFVEEDRKKSHEEQKSSDNNSSYTGPLAPMVVAQAANTRQNTTPTQNVEQDGAAQASAPLPQQVTPKADEQATRQGEQVRAEAEGPTYWLGPP